MFRLRFLAYIYRGAIVPHHGRDWVFLQKTSRTPTASESEGQSEWGKLSSTPGTTWHINYIPFYANSSWDCQAAACLSVYARMSTILQLRTATIFIVVVVILSLSINSTSTTNKVDMVGVWIGPVGVLNVEQQSSHQQITNIHNSEFVPQSSSLRFVSSPVLPTLRVGPARDLTEWNGQARDCWQFFSRKIWSII